ncbi:excinuclease ABC subunit UvrB [Persephonella sp.]
MGKSPFSINLPFEPAGDQPKAIKELYENLKHGVKEQVLLGATGTGKSIHPEETVLFGEKIDNRIDWKIIPIEEVFHYLSTKHPVVLYDDEFVILLPENRYFTLSFSPQTLEEEVKPLYAVTKHPEKRKLLKITLKDGRAITTTEDHNFYAFKEEGFGLFKTAHLQEGDYIPLPRKFNLPVKGVEYIYITDYINKASEKLYFETDQIEDTYREIYRNYQEKLIRAKTCGETGIPIKHFKEKFKRTAILKTNRSKKRKNKVYLTKDFLEFLGIFIAEGFSTGKCFGVSTTDKYYQDLLTKIASEYDLNLKKRNYRDFIFCDKIFAELFAMLCGKKAGDKKLPEFFINLSDNQLAVLLMGIFDGDGYVERNSIELITKSRTLANQILYVLMRFGIWARVRKVFKRATNADHKGNYYFKVSIYGSKDIGLFTEKIGFNIERKQKKAEKLATKQPNTNVDVIPHLGKAIKAKREAYGYLQRDIMSKRQTLSAVETGKRLPSVSTFVKIIDRFDELDIPVEDISLFSNLRWSPIEKIEEIEYEGMVYDFSVKENETFLAGFGGIFVHNTFTIANVIEKYGKPTLVLTHNKTLAAQLYRELKELFPDNAVEYFVSYYDYYQPEAYVPEKDLYIEKDSSINDAIDRLRHSATKSLIERPDTIVVASVSCIYGLGTPEFYEKLRLHLYVGQELDRQQLLKRLVELQYVRDDFSFKRGTFRVKGDTVEIIPSHAEDRIVRVEFFGDEIESITELDLFNRDIKQKLNTTVIFPASHYVIPRPDMVEAIKQIQIDLEKEVEEFRKQGKEIEANRLWQRTNYDIEMMLELGTCKGIENYSRYFDGRKPGEPPYTLMDYFPDDFLLIVDESHVTIPQVRAMYNGDRRRKENLVKYGWRMKSAYDNRPLKFEEFVQKIERAIYVSATPADWEIKRSKGIIVEQIIRPTGLLDPEVIVKPTEGQIDDLINEIWQVKERNERAIVITLTKKMAEHLADYLVDRDIKAIYLHSEIDTIERAKIIKELREGKYDVIVGVNLLREGIDMPEVSLVAVLDADKQGFLRSTTALIQIIGRAARNVHGKAILYADEITPAMEKAIAETERRRKLQKEYNEKHGITPKTVSKEVKELISLEEIGIYEYAEYLPEDVETEEDLLKKIEKLEKEMWQAAENWEFEKAAELRDQIEKLRKLIGVV